ncbi:PH domain-containing protein [Bdellovibrio sp. BCCA]|uniref:PH domain-containing protein n=1 Tax=Bdellovibrio sp. BCCA TaxID=3136281 RepID=UPI0030EFBA24
MIKVRECTRLSILFTFMMVGVWFYQKDIDRYVIKEKNVPKSVKKYFKKKKSFKPHEVILILIGSYTGYFIVRRLTNTYELDPSNLIVNHGIIERTRDPVEMVKVTDISVKTNPILSILGMSSVHVSCPKDESHKKGVFMRFLKNSDAMLVEKHLRDHGVSTITEIIKQRQTQSLEKKAAKKNAGDQKLLENAKYNESGESEDIMDGDEG